MCYRIRVIPEAVGRAVRDFYANLRSVGPIGQTHNALLWSKEVLEDFGRHSASAREKCSPIFIVQVNGEWNQAFGPWAQRNMWEPLSQTPPDFAPGPFDNLIAVGAIGSGWWGKYAAEVLGSKGIPAGLRAAEAATMALPAKAVNPIYDPIFRAAPSWTNRGVLNTAIPYGDVIRTIRYRYSPAREALAMLERMRIEGPHNFVIVGKSGDYRIGDVIVNAWTDPVLRVAPQSGGLNPFGKRAPEAGVKHIQIAAGKPITGGGTVRVWTTPSGGYRIGVVTDTGTYGPHMPVTPQRIDEIKKTVWEAFGYQVGLEDIQIIPFSPR